MKNKISAWGLFVLSVLLLVGSDQGSKHLAEVYLKGKEDLVLLPGVLRLHYLYPENRGIAFGMFQGNVKVFAVISVLIVSLMIVLWVRTPRSKRYLPFRLACVLLISGAVGNLIDRVFRGFVIDFIYFEPIDFPLFNLADCFVVISAFLIAALLIFVYKEDEDLAFLSRQKPKGD